MDYTGPYATKEIGGFNGQVDFVCFLWLRSCFFLSNLKWMHFNVYKINQMCRRSGDVMAEMSIGIVENISEFLTQCHSIDVDRSMKGVEVIPVNVEMQQKNPVERYIQTYNKGQCSAREKDLGALMFLVHYLWGRKDKGVHLRPRDHATELFLNFFLKKFNFNDLRKNKQK